MTCPRLLEFENIYTSNEVWLLNVDSRLYGRYVSCRLWKPKVNFALLFSRTEILTLIMMYLAELHCCFDIRPFSVFTHYRSLMPHIVLYKNEINGILFEINHWLYRVHCHVLNISEPPMFLGLDQPLPPQSVREVSTLLNLTGNCAGS